MIIIKNNNELNYMRKSGRIVAETLLLIEEKITEEPRDASEENVLSGNDETKKKDDSGPDIVGFELI